MNEIRRKFMKPTMGIGSLVAIIGATLFPIYNCRTMTRHLFFQRDNNDSSHFATPNGVAFYQ